MAKILVVDDDKPIRELVAVVLRQHEVLKASNGQEAIEIAFRARPDLIFMDLMMPVLDGAEATHILKSDPATSDIPIVALTAHERGVTAEFDCTLVKPCRPDQLIKMVQEFCPAAG